MSTKTMRIRKRFPPSSISVAALSDQLIRSPVLQPHIEVNPRENLHVVQEETNHNPKNPDPQNQPFLQARSQVSIIRSENPSCENPSWDFLNNGTDERKLNQKEIEGMQIKDGINSSENTRKESIQEELTTTQFPQPSSSSPVIERWCEGDKVVPFKKRKGSFDTIIVSKEIILKVKMKSKTNKKCLQQKADLCQEVVAKTKSSGMKKSKRGSVIMEGSRCSRVNGRGWRCCQQTLVGYSLCEHHLGKGRLRSMTSVRSRAMANQIGANEKDEIIAPLTSNNNINGVDEDDDEKKPLKVVTKKRMKLGAVKARSMSSLLRQTNTSTVVAANGNKYMAKW